MTLRIRTRHKLRAFFLCRLLHWHNPMRITVNGYTEVWCATCDTRLDKPPRHSDYPIERLK